MTSCKCNVLPVNPFHPLVWINGNPEIGENVYIGMFSVVNAKDTTIKIGANCDIAPHVSINTADSHLRCLGKVNEIKRKHIIIENNVFVGTGAVILGGVHIGHHSVIGAGAVVKEGYIPPYSLVEGNPAKIKKGYYFGWV